MNMALMDKMAKILSFVVLFVMMKEGGTQTTEEIPVLTQATCSGEREGQRNEFIAKSRCGAPKDVYINLQVLAAHEKVNPRAVWVKRCVGLCDYDAVDSKCVAIKKHTKYIPVRKYSVKTNLESCWSYPVEEHEECSCCVGSADSCDPLRRMYSPRKFACRHRNRREKRN